MTEAKVVAIPMEMSKVIPKFDGDEKLLNLYIKKCEYVIGCFTNAENQAQDLYVFHVVSSKLTGKAAQLISERQDIESWAALKEVLIQHFGDPRSEECIAIELETLKINQNESYLDFCNRIQQVKSSLIAKVNAIVDPHVRKSKITIYDNLSMNVFLYNLPEDLIRIVRLKSSTTLENALSIVLEEVNFQYQYNARNKMFRAGLTKPQVPASNNPYVEKFGLKQYLPTNAPHQTGFRFGIPNQFRPQNSNSGAQQAPQFKFGIPHTSSGFRPQLSQNVQSGMPNQGPQGYRPNFGTPQGYRPNFGATQGFRPNFNAPQGYRPNFGPQQTKPIFNQSQPNQFKFGIQTQQKPFNTDVTMRTALPAPRPNQAFNNEIEVYADGNNDGFDYNSYEMNYDYDSYDNDHAQVNSMNMTEFYDETECLSNDSNFYTQASDTTMK